MLIVSHSKNIFYLFGYCLIVSLAPKAYIKDSKGEWYFEMSFVSVSSIWNEVNLCIVLGV